MASSETVLTLMTTPPAGGLLISKKCLLLVVLLTGPICICVVWTLNPDYSKPDTILNPCQHRQGDTGQHVMSSTTVKMFDAHIWTLSV